jgi:hypothetical protein
MVDARMSLRPTPTQNLLKIGGHSFFVGKKKARRSGLSSRKVFRRSICRSHNLFNDHIIENSPYLDHYEGILLPELLIAVKALFEGDVLLLNPKLLHKCFLPMPVVRRCPSL